MLAVHLGKSTLLLTEPGRVLLTGVHAVLELLDNITRAVVASSKPYRRIQIVGPSESILRKDQSVEVEYGHNLDVTL